MISYGDAAYAFGISPLKNIFAAKAGIGEMGMDVQIGGLHLKRRLHPF
jgi:hypothetical protein